MARHQSSNQARRESYGRGPLDTARAAFELLVSGPDPIAVEGKLFAGLPDRLLPLNELRDQLLRRRCPQSTRDAVWAHLVLLSRSQGAAWTVGCVGVALPALTTIASRLTAKLAGDPSDVHAAVLAGFLAELARVDLRRPRVMLRLRWAAYRAGHAALREALDAPIPSGTRFRSTEPARPWGHPDLVLARAVAENVITADEAELIGSTRLEGVPLAAAAERRGTSYKALQAARRRAEHRLAAYLRHDVEGADGCGRGGRGDFDLETEAVNAATITTAAQGRRASKKSRVVALKQRAETGVQGCGRKPATPVPRRHTVPSSQTPEVPKCA